MRKLRDDLTYINAARRRPFLILWAIILHVHLTAGDSTAQMVSLFDSINLYHDILQISSACIAVSQQW